MNITLKQLQVFVNTAKASSLSEGAKACFITQAAASMSLGQLEQALGAQLFDRVGKRLRLNACGQDLLIRAMAIVDQANEIQSGCNEKELSGRVVIGASTTVANYVLPKYMAEFKAKHPKVDFDLVISNTDAVIRGIESFEVDFGLIEGYCNNESINRTTWMSDKLEVICRKGHPLTKKKKVVVGDLSAFSWVARESGSGTRKIFEHALPSPDALSIEITLDSSEAIGSYVASSDCLAYLSSSILNQSLGQKAVSVLAVNGVSLERSFYCLQHKMKYQALRCQQFLQYLGLK